MEEIEKIKEIIHKMFESALVFEKNTSPNDINKSQDLIAGLFIKLLNDSMKIDYI